jgi:Secretion system C-terminal sorting domain
LAASRKTNLILKTNYMKNLIFTTILVSSLISNSFGQAVIADPALNVMRTASTVSTSLPVDPTLIPIDSVISLKVPVINYNLNNALPSGTCKIKVNLGSKIVLDPTFDLNTVNTSAYFQWTASNSSGVTQITGDLIAPLPANFLDTASFNIKGSILGNSTITTNFLVTNHNTTVTLSDENGANNNAFLSYTIVERSGGPVPVTFTKVVASKEGCSVKLNFDTENEINVDRFEIEVSKDGIHFEKMGTLATDNSRAYYFSFLITENIKAAQLFIRVKSVDKDAQFQYSDIRKVAGTCDSKSGAVIIFPNPAAYETRQFTIRSQQGSFNGIYTVSVSDISGKLMNKKIVTLVNASQFDYDAGTLASGQYIVSIINAATAEKTVVKWQKK